MSSVTIRSFKLEESEAGELSYYEKTSNPRSGEQFSNFGDGACGEPLFAQHLVLDFTPDADIDNEIVQKKTCAFWNLVNNTPEIRNLMVKPERPSYSKSVITDQGSVKSKCEPEYDEDDVVDMGRTAVSMLEVVEEKGLITRTFEAKMPQSRCTFDSREYKENEPNTQQKEKRRKSRVPIVCKCTSICRPCPAVKPLSKLKKMCKKLTEWDAKHPKSMEPPGHPPALHHCILQRQVFE